MAKLTREDILKLAQLAKIHLTDAEIDDFRKEITTILGYVEQLQGVDLTDVAPTYQVTGLTNVMREDEVVDYAQTQSELLKNAPQRELGQIKVRRILE